MRRLSILAVIVLVAGACGDDEDRLTQAEFQEQGNAICAEGNEELEVLFEDLPQDEAPTEAELEPLYDDFLENIRGQVDGIDELSPPEDMEEDVDQLVSDARAALDEMEDDGPSSLLGEDDPFAEVNEQAEALGLTECSG